MSRYIFEVSWEVANKVGGIYTVISSKAKYVKERYGENYFVIGPYLGAKNESEFHFLNPPEKFQDCLDNLIAKGVIVYYGEWLIEGRPKGFLIDFRKYLFDVNSFKYELWLKYQIDSLRTGQDYDEPLAWSRGIYDFISELVKNEEFKYSIFHFHEWLSGFALLFSSDLPIIKIFTTHATVLGRTLSSNNIHFWENLDKLNPEEEAYKYGVEAKHLVEKASAQKADFFTTISQITKEEAEVILKRKVDFVLPNGLDLSRFLTFEEISAKHRINKSILQEFILYFFSPYFKNQCPIKNSLIFFTSGRKEIVNKGFDVLLQALGLLNKKLKEEKSEVDVYFFFFVPDEIIDVNREVLNNLITYKSLEEFLKNIQGEIFSRILHQIVHQKEIEIEKIFSLEEKTEIERIIKKISTHNKPPLSTHVLREDNELLKLAYQNNLLNLEEDKVKIIFYPIYLNSADGFLNLNYYDAINGCHLGVFPSYYEPWGYTPLETLGAGVMTITTDMTGFANYLEEKRLITKDNPGIWILRRKNRKNEEVVKDLFQLLYKITKMKRSERIQNKYEARILASHFSWEKLIVNYFDLYETAWQKFK